MTEQADLFTGARRVFWGYFFLLLDFNLNFNSDFTIPLLPNFVGWIFLWRGVDALSSARPSLELLKPFCTALGVCALTQFLPEVEGMAPDWLSLLISVMILYTYFQLLTDLASLAEEVLGDGEVAGRLRLLRPILVVSQTVLYCSDLLNLFIASPGLVLLLALANFCVYVVLLIQLWTLSRELESPQSP